ncbi:MAG TPA: hypothetical protein VKV15_05145 [Bryobacteraceae bacterium]|nr:hypothetical protein [Bryobacteraceae bacterium]
MSRSLGKYENLEQDEKIDTALDVIRQLASCLEEVHQEELQTKRRGNSKAKGPDPGNCSYCAALREADEFLDAVNPR